MNAQVQEAPKLKRNKAGQIMKGTGGRPKGVPNKTTVTLKQAVLLAAEQAGNHLKAGSGLVGYLKHLAIDEPKAFSGLLGRTLPLDVTSSDGSMRPVVAVYMPDNNRDGSKARVIEHAPAKAIQCDVEATVDDTAEDQTPAQPEPSLAMRAQD